MEASAKDDVGMEQVSSDEGMYRFRRGYGGRNSGRMRLPSLKWATYKLKNNNDTVLLAA